jgi:hypothetical protein
MAELQAEAEIITRKLAKRVMGIFNWNDINDETINFWQQKLLTRLGITYPREASHRTTLLTRGILVTIEISGVLR